MASPLAWFRRNQKGMLIVFGVLLMAVFGLPSVFFNMTPQGSQNEEMAETVLKFNGGDYTRGQLREYRRKNAQAVRFTRELQQAAVERLGGPENYIPKAEVAFLLDGDTPGQSDRLVMQQIVLLKKAEEIGMTVGNVAVEDYLRDIANDDDMTPRQLEQFCFEVFKGKPDYITVREQLKKDLASQQMMAIIASGGIPSAPNITEAWQHWQKLNKRRSANVVEFPVATYVSKVTGEPKLADLRSLFAEGEYKFPDISRAEPGFKQRRKVKVVTFRGVFEDFMTNAENKITNEQVEELYNQMVDAKDGMVMELVEKEEAPEEGEDASPEFNLGGEDVTEQTTPGSEGAESGEGEMETPETTPESMEGESSEGESSEGESVEGESTEGESSEAESSEGEGGEEGGEGESEEEGGDGLPTSGPSLGTQEETKQESAGTEVAEAVQETTEAAEVTQETTEVADPPVQVPVTPPTTNQEVDLVGDLGADEPERRVKPLDEELAKLLKRQIALQPATTAMNNAILDASGEVLDYGSDLDAWENSKDGPVEEREEKPEPIDMDKIAKEYKLQLQETELVDLAEFRDSPLGQTQVSIQQFFRGQSFAMPAAVSDFVFERYYDFSEWSPETLTEYNSSNQLVMIVTEKSDPKVRTFDEAKEDVIEFWRHGQAVKLAEAAAQQIVDGMNSSGETLEQKYPADARSLGEFTYHTSASLYPELTAVGIGEGAETIVPSVVRTSPEFMKTAFALDAGKAGVAVDASRDIVYAIQLTSVDDRTEADLQELFFNEVSVNQGVSRGGIARLFQTDQQEFMQKYFEEIEEEFEIKWLAH